MAPKADNNTGGSASLRPWWHKDKKKTMVNCERGTSDITVRQHTRKRFKVTSKRAVAVRKKKQEPKAKSMDVASYRLITTIQKDEMKEAIAANKAKADITKNVVKEQWQSFMKSSVKASKRAKGKMKSAKRREKKDLKDKREMEVQEFIALQAKVFTVDVFDENITSDERSRYHELLKLNHCSEYSW